MGDLLRYSAASVKSIHNLKSSMYWLINKSSIPTTLPSESTSTLQQSDTGIALLIVATIVGYRLFDHVALRVEAWWSPWQEASGRSFQIVQSLLAFASGGVLGQGLGQGLPTAIPVVHTDFVFAAIGEEFGLVGTVAVIACFALLAHLHQCYRVDGGLKIRMDALGA